MEITMFTFRYNVTGADRKRLVQAIAEIHGGTPRYLGAPTFAYEVDYFTVSRDGAVSFDDRADSEEIETLVEQLAERGFEAEEVPEASQEDTEMPMAGIPATDASGLPGPNAAELPTTAPESILWGGVVSEYPQNENGQKTASERESSGFCIELPREGVTDDALRNLRQLVDSKAALIRKALGADRLDIDATDERIAFLWFDAVPDAEMASAAARFAGRLLDAARTQKRVTARERPVENEKFAFRCFLLRLGFIGPEYKADRKTLLRNLTGSAAFKGGDRRARRGADEGGVNDEISEQMSGV